MRAFDLKLIIKRCGYLIISQVMMDSAPVVGDLDDGMYIIYYIYIQVYIRKHIRAVCSVV